MADSRVPRFLCAAGALPVHRAKLSVAHTGKANGTQERNACVPPGSERLSGKTLRCSHWQCQWHTIQKLYSDEDYLDAAC
jgi:hypothetical protein